MPRRSKTILPSPDSQSLSHSGLKQPLAFAAHRIQAPARQDVNATPPYQRSRSGFCGGSSPAFTRYYTICGRDWYASCITSVADLSPTSSEQSEFLLLTPRCITSRSNGVSIAQVELHDTRLLNASRQPSYQLPKPRIWSRSPQPIAQRLASHYYARRLRTTLLHLRCALEQYASAAPAKVCILPEGAPRLSLSLEIGPLETRANVAEESFWSTATTCGS